MSNYCKECYKKQEQIEQLQAENKELESSLVSQASTIFTLEKSSNDLSQGINKLYKALQEIRKIADETIDNRDPYIRMYAGEMYCRPIIEIINSVKGANQ